MHLRALVSSWTVAAALFTGCGDDKASLPPADTASPDGSDTASPDGSDTASPDGDDTASPPVAADHVFRFSATPGQTISSGPFPSDGLLNSAGTVALAPLGADPNFQAIMKTSLLSRLDPQIAKRRGFSFLASAYFPMDAAPDLASFDGRVTYVALSGPETGKLFPAEVRYLAPVHALAVAPAWGHYLVPGATYAIVIASGVRTEAGTVIEAPPAFAAVIAAEAGDPSPELAATRAVFASLRAHLASVETTPIVATVFTTEATLPYVRALFAEVDAFTREAPTAALRLASVDAATGAETWDEGGTVSGAGLTAYFGTPEAPFAWTPGNWDDGTRQAAAAWTTTGEAYTGGAFSGDVALVVNGSFVAPSFSLRHAEDAIVAGAISYNAQGKPEVQSRVLVPYTLYLCEDAVVDGAPREGATVPIAVFTHGGTANRTDAIAFAALNCTRGIATIAADLPFHGGRQTLAYAPTRELIAPTQVDDINQFSGKKRGDAGFVPDGVGDGGDALKTVGGLFGLTSAFDPEIIEANLISIAVESYTLIQYLKDAGPTGLGAALGITLDTDHLVMEGLSFGTSFTLPVLAATSEASVALISVGSSAIVSRNLPMAPNNATLAGGALRLALGLPTALADINQAAYFDPGVALLQWLSERGDPGAYAPFVLRYRDDSASLHVLGMGDSWDETLHSGAQMAFGAALGVPVLSAGVNWTLAAAIPGADAQQGTPYAAPLTNNLTLTTPGPGHTARTQSAGMFYNAAACHAQVVTPLCTSSWQSPYPPLTARTPPVVMRSPICAMHASMQAFLRELGDPTPPSVVAPEAASGWDSACERVYDIQ